MSQLKVLVEMQSFDDKIGEKLQLQKKLPKELQSLIDNVEQATNNKDEAKNELDNNVKDQKNKELEVKANKEKMQKYESQQMQVKTNKEFKALNSEIAQLKAKNAQLDEDVLALMDQEGEKRDLLKAAEGVLAKAETELKNREGKLKKRLSEIDGEIDALKKERNKLAVNLPKSLIKRYGLLIKNKERKAVVFVDNNACGGCGFKLRPQQIIEVDSNKKMISCENCGRILAKGDE
jgi:predicted  nucleic acid-binding Zn-ribbon protein